MKFDNTKLALPFHPGDPLWEVEREQDGYRVKKSADKVIGVLITEDSIRIIRKMADTEGEVEFITVEPNEFPEYFLSEEEAEQYASVHARS